MDAKIKEYRKGIAMLCQRHNVRNLFLFGSILTDRFNAKSDVDCLVNFNDSQDIDPFLNFFGLKEGLEQLFGREVDLVDESAITNPYFYKEIISTRQQIYG